MRKFLPPPGFDPRPVQSVASRYADPRGTVDNSYLIRTLTKYAFLFIVIMPLLPLEKYSVCQDISQSVVWGTKSSESIVLVLCVCVCVCVCVDMGCVLHGLWIGDC